MTLEEQIYGVLNPLASGGAWPQVVRQGVPAPYLVYQQMAFPNTSLDGASDTQNVRLQVDCYAATYLDVRALRKAVQAAMAASAIVNVPLPDTDFTDPTTKLFRVLMEFSIWSNL